ncbi:hypothetical protein CEXT_339971 [Caerostris extrusa]|uniref:Secreted protein n=1 Tax=Caerostris extrusa TaxID=172846 RepID=A0AAV4Q7B9_CAEEX|nr:hypothetical protein CEXT_339971 [Caerostris extrusa]
MLLSAPAFFWLELTSLSSSATPVVQGTDLPPPQHTHTLGNPAEDKRQDAGLDAQLKPPNFRHNEIHGPLPFEGEGRGVLPEFFRRKLSCVSIVTDGEAFLRSHSFKYAFFLPLRKRLSPSVPGTAFISRRISVCIGSPLRAAAAHSLALKNPFAVLLAALPAHASRTRNFPQILEKALVEFNN